MEKYEVKQKVIKLSRNSNATSRMFACKSLYCDAGWRNSRAPRIRKKLCWSTVAVAVSSTLAVEQRDLFLTNNLMHEGPDRDEKSVARNYSTVKIKLIPIGLEVMQICYTNLKASISAEVGCFIKNLLEISPDILREYLIHLQEHMDLIHHDKLFDLLARVRALIKEVSTLIRDLEEKSRNKESTDKTSRATLDLLKNIELLKEDLRYVYLKAPDSYQCCFPMNDGPLFMHLLLIHLNGLLASNSYSIALIKEEITLVKEALEFIRSFFVNVEQGLYKNLWARVLDVAYEAKDAIDSIIGRDNGFEEETNWLITKLTSGPKDLDVISITGMPGSGKTTLAYKVHNDDLVCCHFDLRAWCTVDQEYDEKKLLVKLFNQVIGSDFKSSEDIDVADKLRKQLYGKRHLIVLDDVWDINTWDDLTRPFPEAEKGSRIILTNR
ncbi:hypothetical protein BC332_14639 [Capsicum chinense]|nr:hypothetical protein BC332_14639 [Capsicum chinense]